MADKNNEKKLFEEFPPVSTEQWREKINADLKGADFNKKLVWRTKEGIHVQPYYRAEDLIDKEYLDNLPGDFPFVRATDVNNKNNWYIRQDVDATSSIEDANQKALKNIEKGADSICFLLDPDKEYTDKDILSLLNGIRLEDIEIVFDAGKASLQLLDILIDTFPNIKGSLEFDPIGRLATHGNFCKPEDDVFQTCKEILKKGKKLNKFRSITINGKFFRNAGSTITEELAFSLAMATDYMDKLTELGFSSDEVAQAIKVNLGIGSDYFTEIAKIRAARLLWAKMIEAFKPEDEQSKKICIHAETTLWNNTIYDPYVNMLRTTTEGMSAVIGGIHSLTINPFNLVYQKPTEFSERIARNQQILLKEESYFDKVLDPSAGSYYLENLTDILAEESWKLFLKIESNGGFIKSFKEGMIQDLIKETVQKRNIAIATRKETLLGTNQFPNFSEKADSEINLDIVKTKQETDKEKIAEPIKFYRGSEAFEELRIKTDKSDKTPTAFMLTYGNLAMRKARSQFSCNFFACAGFEVIDNNGFKTVDEGVQEAILKNADIVVICSSDEEYTTIAPEINQKIRNQAIVVVAGMPKNADELKENGLEHFIHVKSNILEELKKFQSMLGIK